jgi:DNA-binding NarL/FixJ family response regulator
MLKVLIAEDSVMLADCLEDFLNAKGFEVCGIASTVDEAVLLADLHRPDLAIFNFRLANFGFGPEIRPRLEDKITMGILYVSGDSLKNSLTKLDGEAFMQKPYSLNDIEWALGAIRKIMTGIPADTTSIPKSFHLLGASGVQDRHIS